MVKLDDKESNTRVLYIELNKFGQTEEYEKAIKIANKILNINPDDILAAQCKVVGYIQTSKFNEALQFIERQKLTVRLVFEKAYCEYRLNQPQKALNTIDGSRNNNAEGLLASLKELRAQVLYRLEQYDECFDAYKDIIKNTHDDYEDERLNNLSAVFASLASEKTQKDISNIREDTYEICYNVACALAERQCYGEAEKKLRQCEKMFLETLDDESMTLEDPSTKEQLTMIRVQLAYCLQMQGKIKDSIMIYAEALKQKSSDTATIAVASNNSMVVNKDQNVFDSKKKIRAAMTDACEHALNSRQKCAIALNNCLLTLYTNHAAEQSYVALNKLIQIYPNIEFEALLIRVSQMAKDKNFKEAIDQLQTFANGHINENVAAKFAIVQLLLLNGNKKAAIDVLQSLGAAKYRPGVVSAIVTLLLGTEQKTAAAQVLKDAVEWYKRAGQQSSGDLTDMWRQAADFHLRGGEPETAASSLEELYKRNPNDVRILAQLVIAYASFDATKAQKASKQLPIFNSLTNATEIDNLEASNWMMSMKAAKKTASSKADQSPAVTVTPITTTNSGTGNDIKQNKKRNRMRKGKMPKNYDPDSQPDPERWLPRYERSGYRRKRDRRTKDVIKGSQGTSGVGVADQYDITKSQVSAKSSPISIVGDTPTPGPRYQQRKTHQKKKKGRF